MTQPELPVPVLDHPHWHVNFRPNKHTPDALTTGEAFECVRKAQVRLRGTYYPNIDHRTTRHQFHTEWCAAWFEDCGIIEYWRFYRSTQFVQLFATRENTTPSWKSDLASRCEKLLTDDPDAKARVAGYLSIINVIHTLSEIYEFASRLTQAGIYEQHVDIKISIRKIKDHAIIADDRRAWWEFFSSTGDEVRCGGLTPAEKLISDTSGTVADAAAELFTQFGWHNPPSSIFKKEAEQYLAAKR